MMARHTPGVFNILKNSKVAIAGCGGLGSNVAVSLARVGVGNIILCDFDIVEPSNLNRQQYFVSDIGKFKVCALKDILLRINPFINIKKHRIYLDKTNIEEIFKEADIIGSGLMAPRVAICANHMANKAIRILCKNF